MKAGFGICYAVAQIQHNPKSAQGKLILPAIDGVFGTTTMGTFGSFIKFDMVKNSVKVAVCHSCASVPLGWVLFMNI